MKILNVKIDTIKKADALSALNLPQIIFTPNPEILLEARKNKAFRRSLKKGTMMLPDGHGLLLVSTLLKLESKWLRALALPFALIVYPFWKELFRKEIPEVIHGSDFMDDVTEWACKNSKSVFFLGGKGDVAKHCASYFKVKFPSLNVAGFSNTDPGVSACNEVKKSGAQVLFVAYGAPKQEIWIAKYAHQLKELEICMGVGGSFDFWSGAVKRAPQWMRNIGTEWLWRLALEPRIRLKRIYAATVKFPVIALFFS